MSSNNFSLNQAALVLDHPADPGAGQRWGARLDLQWGQATQTVQGNPANEPRPEIYRNIFQAYGTYVVPLGKGVNVDFGKWASSLGIEGNYTKDQMNYSRSYWFNFLPFYHMGARVNYQVNDRLGINYWITNGTQQTEDFNGFKDQLGGVVLHPRKNISWTVNYYFGQEHPDVAYFLFGPAPEPDPPTNQGVPFVPIRQLTHRQAAHFRHLRHLAADTDSHLRPGGRLRDSAAVSPTRPRSMRMAERSTRSINSRLSSPWRPAPNICPTTALYSAASTRP